MKRFVSCLALTICLGVLAGCTSGATTSKPASTGGAGGPKSGTAPTETVGNVPPPSK